MVALFSICDFLPNNLENEQALVCGFVSPKSNLSYQKRL
jgi:hypothetical protein